MIAARGLGGGMIAAILLGVSVVRADDAAPGVSSSVDCGTMALYNFLQVEGRPADLPALNRRLPAEAPAEGYSLQELREAARASGLATTGVQLRPADFPLDRPALAYLRRDGHGHFVVVRPVGHSGTLVQVIDPGRGPLVMETVDLLAAPEWTGRALVPGRPIRLAPAVAWGLAAIPMAGWLLLARKHRPASRPGRASTAAG